MTRALLIALVLTLIPLTSEAQNHLDNRTELQWLLTEKQMLASLNESNEAILTQTFENTILLAVLYRDKIDLHRMVDPTIAVHRRSSSPEVKEKALAALHAIGTDRALTYFKRASEEDQMAGRARAMGVIDSYLAGRALVAR